MMILIQGSIRKVEAAWIICLPILDEPVHCSTLVAALNLFKNRLSEEFEIKPEAVTIRLGDQNRFELITCRSNRLLELIALKTLENERILGSISIGDFS